MENKKIAIWSIIALMIDTFLLISLLIGWPLIANKFNKIYSDFKIEIPTYAKISLSKYNLFFILLLLILIAKEFFMKKKASLIINIVFAAIFILALFPFLIFGLFGPVFELTNIGK